VEAKIRTILRLLAALLLILETILYPLAALADPQQSAEEAAGQIAEASRWIAVAGFMATLLISTVGAVLSAHARHRPLSISLYSLAFAAAYLILTFSLNTIYATLSNVVGLQSQYEAAITSVSYRINNTKSIINAFAWTAGVMKLAGGALEGAGQYGLQSLDPSAVEKIGQVAEGRLRGLTLRGALSVVAVALGGALDAVGTSLFSMFNTLVFYYGAFFMVLYGLLFLLKFFGELPLWLAFASLGLSIAAFRPLRGLGATLFATMIVFAIGLPLAVNGMEIALSAMNIPANKEIVCGFKVEEGNVNIVDALVNLIQVVLFNPGEYVWCIFEGLAKTAVVPSVFYGMGVGIVAAGAAEMAAWMSESQGFANIAYALTSVVRA